MKYKFLLLSLLFFSNKLLSQDYNSTLSSLTNYAKRIYNIEKFEGVKIVENDIDKFLIVAVKLEKKNNTSSVLNTISFIKAKSYYSSFQNGSFVISESIVITKNNDSLQSNPISNEVLKEYSSGFVKGLSMLTSFDAPDPKYIVSIFYTKL